MLTLTTRLVVALAVVILAALAIFGGYSLRIRSWPFDIELHPGTTTGTGARPASL